MVILEKKPFDLNDVKSILSDETEAKIHLKNDIYSSADLFPNASLNGKYNFEVLLFWVWIISILCREWSKGVARSRAGGGAR